MGPRTNLSATLVIAAVTLLVAIAIGNEMGNRVLGQATERGPAIAATPVGSPLAAATGDAGGASWKHEQIVSVATDPAFPDPRITPEPPPPPPARTPAPRQTPSPRPAAAATATASHAPYTSPPLPFPIATHSEEPAASAQESPSPEPSPTSPAT